MKDGRRDCRWRNHHLWSGGIHSLAYSCSMCECVDVSGEYKEWRRFMRWEREKERRKEEILCTFSLHVWCHPSHILTLTVRESVMEMPWLKNVNVPMSRDEKRKKFSFAKANFFIILFLRIQCRPFSLAPSTTLHGFFFPPPPPWRDDEARETPSHPSHYHGIISLPFNTFSFISPFLLTHSLSRASQPKGLLISLSLYTQNENQVTWLQGLLQDLCEPAAIAFSLVFFFFGQFQFYSTMSKVASVAALALGERILLISDLFFLWLPMSTC